MGNKVAAIVVTYNRKVLLAEAVRALLNQSRKPDGIIVINNACTDGTREFLVAQRLDQCPGLSIIDLEENRGCAGGFCVGVKEALAKGYDWIWMMDDDSIADPYALERMLDHSEHSDVAALANIKVDNAGAVLYDHLGNFDLRSGSPTLIVPERQMQAGPFCVDVDFSSFVGLMARAEACRAVGPPRAEMFLHHDDVEFCLRLRRWGRVAAVCDSVIVHKAVEASAVTHIPVRRFGLTSQRPTLRAQARGFFGGRNYIWLALRCRRGRARTISGEIAMAVRRTLGVLLFDSQPWPRLGLIWGTVIQGISGRFDNQLPRRILEGAQATSGRA